MASEALRPFGAYVLLRALGRGAMGDVHLARPYNAHRGIPTPVVIKRLLGELAHKKGFIARFRHEASVAVSVDSPNVAKVYDVGSVGDALYIVMEYVAGWPMSSVLEAIMKSGRHASVPSVLDAIIGALDGLHAIHTAIDQTTGKPLGIVHRDISPKNLIVGEDGRVRVIDLGLGKSNAQDWKTRTGVVMGSVGYMPPEQAAGEHVDVRADVYAIAAVAYEMLALRNYIKRGPLTDMMAESMSPRFRPPSQVRPDVPPDLDAILEKALRPKKEDRFADAAELRDALARLARPGDLQGQLAELVDDLFGATKHERERDLDALLALPLPVDESEEHEATQVFVQRAGVAPDSIAPDDQRADRTRQVPAKALTRDRIVRPRPRDPDATEPPIPRDHGGSKELLRRSPASGGADATAVDEPSSVPPTVATELAWGGPSGRLPAASLGPETEAEVMVVEVRDTLPPDPFGAASVRMKTSAPAKGVSFAVLVVSVVLAAIVGAAAAVVLSRSPTPPAAPTIEERAVAPAVERRPSVAAVPIEVSPTAAARAEGGTEPDATDVGADVDTRGDDPAERRGAEPARDATKRRRAQTEATREAARPTSEPVSAEPSRARIDDDVRALLARTDALITRLPSGPKRDRALQLKLDLRRDQSAAGDERIRETVRRVRAEILELESTDE